MRFQSQQVEPLGEPVSIRLHQKTDEAWRSLCRDDAPGFGRWALTVFLLNEMHVDPAVLKMLPFRVHCEAGVWLELAPSAAAAAETLTAGGQIVIRVEDGWA